MILRKLIMHNFGVYASTNQFDFCGEGPVVLIGGMNGRGKTTFLEAVLLGLYGANSFAYTESKYKTYGQYLRSYVNRADGTLQAYVEIEFSMDGSEEEVYFIHREWSALGRRVGEKIHVKKNGEDNNFLTENWPMFVENILPSALSSFFFFDGEKIAELAVENTDQKMKESIKAMLGISVLDLLDNDLGRIISRLSNEDAEDQDLSYCEKLRKKRDSIRAELKNADTEITENIEKIDLLRAKLEKKQSEYAIKGGDIVEQRHDLIRQRSEAVATVQSQQELLLELVSGAMPMILVQPLLQGIEEQGRKEQENRAAQLATEKVSKLYKSFLKQFPDAKGEIQRFVEYVQEESALHQVEEVYHISDNTLYQVTSLNKGELENIDHRARVYTAKRNSSQDKIDEVDNYLSVDIDEKALNRIYKRIKELELSIASAEVELEDAKQRRTTIHGEAMIADAEFSKAVERLLSTLETSDDDKRIVKYAHMAIEIIKHYRIRLQENKSEKLAETMTECYKQLANKKNLIEKIMMDPETLDLHYLNSEGEEVEKKSLSAGEKQLMVISLLWALAICSKKKLPVIIDTPLSRLDSVHRESLITTYFPNASDQTIILSTDSEIDEKYYQLMKPSIGDEFTLVYDDALKKTTIQEGYLFSEGREV